MNWSHGYYVHLTIGFEFVVLMNEFCDKKSHGGNEFQWIPERKGMNENVISVRGILSNEYLAFI